VPNPWMLGAAEAGIAAKTLATAIPPAAAAVLTAVVTFIVHSFRF
jgi:hypothetical protein